MSLVNHAKGEINVKIVYYGPVFSGKGTNLNYIYRKLKPEHRGQLKTMNVEKNRMLFFDFAPAGQGKLGDYSVRFHVYSIVGEVTGNTAWKMVLKGADGLVFVADSSRERMKANDESVVELRKIMRSYGMSIKDLPGVLQCNKRDMDSPVPVEEMENALNYGGFTVMPAVAGKGEGVLESLFALMKGVLKNLRESGVVPGVEPEQPAATDVVEPAAKVEEPPAMEAAPPVIEGAAQVKESITITSVEVPEPPVALVEEQKEAAAPVIEPVKETVPPEVFEPVIEIVGQAEPLTGGRLRLPLKVRCGESEKEVALTITVAVGLE